MIGMIALAGIIVRNSILLVDRSARLAVPACPCRGHPPLRHRGPGHRAPPASAAMGGALFILSDPIFQRAPPSRSFSVSPVSTVLTLRGDPDALYHWPYRCRLHVLTAGEPTEHDIAPVRIIVILGAGIAGLAGGLHRMNALAREPRSPSWAGGPTSSSAVQPWVAVGWREARRHHPSIPPKS